MTIALGENKIHDYITHGVHKHNINRQKCWLLVYLHFNWCKLACPIFFKTFLLDTYFVSISSFMTFPREKSIFKLIISHIRYPKIFCALLTHVIKPIDQSIEHVWLHITKVTDHLGNVEIFLVQHSTTQLINHLRGANFRSCWKIKKNSMSKTENTITLKGSADIVTEFFGKFLYT